MSEQTSTPPQTMLAIQQSVYGPPSVLSPTKTPLPTPKPHQLLLRVHCTSPHKGDLHLIHGKPYFIRLLFGGLFKPTIRTPGTDVSGVVIAHGGDDQSPPVGTAVFGDLSESSFGAFAEYATVDARHVAPLPRGCTPRQAAALGVSAIAALQAVRDHANVTERMRVLVLGASGGVGSYAVQMVKAFGGVVTAVCRGPKCDAVRQLKPDAVHDSDTGDVVDSGTVYDVVIDAAMYRPPSDYVPVLKEGGKYVGIGGDPGLLLRFMLGGAFWMTRFKQRRASFLESKPSKQDLEEIVRLVEEGKVIPLIDDEQFGLEDIPDALRKIEERRVVGKIVVDVVKDS